MLQLASQTDELWPFYFESCGELPSIQKLLYCGLHDPDPELAEFYRGKYYYRRRAIQMLWNDAAVLWHPWIDRALRSFCEYNWITWTGPAARAQRAIDPRM